MFWFVCIVQVHGKRDAPHNLRSKCAWKKSNDADELEFYANFTENKLHFRRNGPERRKCEQTNHIEYMNLQREIDAADEQLNNENKRENKLWVK